MIVIGKDNKEITIIDCIISYSNRINPIITIANPTKWSIILKQFVGNLPTNCLSVFDHFVGLALKELN